MTSYWADVVRYPTPSSPDASGGGGGTGSVVTQIDFGFLPIIIATTLDAGTVAGQLNSGDGTQIAVRTSVTGITPGAALSATGTGQLLFAGDVQADALLIQGGSINTTGTLTLGATTTLASPDGTLHFTGITNTAIPTGALVNHGTISLAAAPASARQRIYLAAISNDGMFTLGAGDTLGMAAPVFANAGTLAIETGASLDLVSAAFANTGSITLASGATLSLALASDLPALAGRLGALTNAGGTLDIQLTGSLDNTGAVFNLAAAEAQGVTGLGRPGYVPCTRPIPGGYVSDPNKDGIAATLTGGTLEAGTTLHLGGAASPGFTFGNTTLTDVDVRGVLELGAGASLTVAGTTRFSDANGSGGSASIGDINLTGDGAHLTFAAATTLEHTGILISPGTSIVLNTVTIVAENVVLAPAAAHLVGGAPPSPEVLITAKGHLTIGSDSYLAAVSNQTRTQLDVQYGLTNRGTIATAGMFALNADTAGFVNDGLLTVAANSTAFVFGDYSGAGRIELAGGDTLQITGATDAADIRLAGTGNTVILDTLTTGLTLDGLSAGDTLSLFNATPLTSARYAAGHLYLYSNGAQSTDIATDSDLANATLLIIPALTGGTLSIVADGPFDTAILAPPQDAGRLIIGTAGITNSGILHIADGGAVEFQGAVTNAGALAFDGAAGSLILDHPQGFRASITAMQLGDTITLAPGAGYSLAYAGDTLEALQNGTLAASFTFAPGHSLADFTLDSSGQAPTIAMVAHADTDTSGQAFLITNVTWQQHSTDQGDSYAGPVAGLTRQFIDITTDNLNIATDTPNVFIRTGSGDDAIQVTSGDNVIDASTGSNFLVGGTGHDTFFLDTRGGQTMWDTIANFHAFDSVTIWGYGAGSTNRWVDGLGTAGYTGLTLQIAPAGGAGTVNATFVGLSSADLSQLTVQTGSVDGTSYLSIIHG